MFKVSLIFVAFCAGVSLNIHSFIYLLIKCEITFTLTCVRFIDITVNNNG